MLKLLLHNSFTQSQVTNTMPISNVPLLICVCGIAVVCCLLGGLGGLFLEGGCVCVCGGGGDRGYLACSLGLGGV